MQSIARQIQFRSVLRPRAAERQRRRQEKPLCHYEDPANSRQRHSLTEVARRRWHRSFGHESVRVAGSIAGAAETVKLGKGRGSRGRAVISRVRRIGYLSSFEIDRPTIRESAADRDLRANSAGRERAAGRATVR